MSRAMAKVSVLVLEGVIFILARAATTTTTNRTCNNVDFAANTLGKVITAFFFFYFYIMCFFIFTGAPDWPKYQGLSLFKTLCAIFVDGMARFGELTTGVWTDATGNV
jgi:hypothetical protein